MKKMLFSSLGILLVTGASFAGPQVMKQKAKMTRAASKVELKDITAPVGTNIFFEARLISDKGELISGKLIDFKVNDKSIGGAPTAEPGTANAGMARKEFHVSGDYPPGTYKIAARFAGDITAGPGLGQGILTVTKAQTKLELKLLHPPQVSIGGDCNMDGHLRNAHNSAPIGDRWVTIRVGNVEKKDDTSKEGYFREGFSLPATMTSGWESTIDYTFEAEFAGDAYYESSRTTLILKAIPQPAPVITSVHPPAMVAGERISMTIKGTDLWPNGKNIDHVRSDQSARFIINDGHQTEDCKITGWSNASVSVECLKCYYTAPGVKVKAVVNGKESNIFELPVIKLEGVTIRSISPEKTQFGSPADSPGYHLYLQVYPLVRYMDQKFKLTFAGEELPDYAYRGSGRMDDWLAGSIDFWVPEKFRSQAGRFPIQLTGQTGNSNIVYWNHTREFKAIPEMKKKGVTITPQK